MSRLTDVMLAFPFLIIAVALAAISGPNLGNAVVALGIAQIPTMIRVVRGETMRIRSTDFVLSARTMDATGLRVIFAHVLPNCVSAIIVQATVIMPVAVIGEALLSFLGLGISPPTPSWGNMLTNGAQDLARGPWLVWAPGVAIFLTVLCLYLLGDGLRDALDPRMNRTG